MLGWNLNLRKSTLFRAVQKCIKHPAGPRQKLSHVRAIYAVQEWLWLSCIQLPQLKSVIPQLKYKSLCNWSTYHLTYVLSVLSTGCSACHFPQCRALSKWFCEPLTTESKECKKVCTVASICLAFYLARRNSSRKFRTALSYLLHNIVFAHRKTKLFPYSRKEDKWCTENRSSRTI